ncbi:MAG: hypothetical protein ABW003_05735 [Microvirga sp.]
MHNVRAYLLNILELVDRDPGIKAASDDLYAVAKEFSGGPDRGTRMSWLLQEAFLRSCASVTASDRQGRASTSDRARLAVITGAQVRQARKLLGWEPSKLARRAKVHSLIVERAESVASEPPITAYQGALIKQALVNAGVEFTNGDEPGVKLKAKGKMPRFAEPA